MSLRGENGASASGQARKKIKVTAGGDFRAYASGQGPGLAESRFGLQSIGGRLVELPIAGKEGKRVKKGDLLARIDAKDFQAKLRNAQGALRQAQAGLKLAKSEYARIQRIRKRDPGAVSQADVDRKREAVDVAKGRIKSLQATVDEAKNMLSYTYLRAPFSGVIAKRYVDNFQEVRPKQPIANLQDVSHVEVLVDVPENIMALAKSRGKGAVRVTAEFPSAPGKQFPLELKEYATRADPATQTYQVVFQMPQPKEIRLLPGMTASVRVSVKGEKAETGRILVPAIAVVGDSKEESFVWVVDPKEMIVHKRAVNPGSLTGSENVEIMEGLKGGETIVVAGVTKLREGMKVRLWKQ